MRIKEIRIVCDGDNCLGPETNGMLKNKLVINDVLESRHVNIEYLSFRMTQLFNAQGWKRLNGKHYCFSCWEERKKEKTNKAAIGN